MAESAASQTLLKRSRWLAIAVGALAHVGLKTLVPTVLLVGVRFWSLETDNTALWLENPGDASHPVWYALQGSIILGAALAGALAAALGPRKSVLVPVALAALSLFATGFEQFPNPMSRAVLALWAGGPCVGLLLGYFLVARLARGDA